MASRILFYTACGCFTFMGVFFVLSRAAVPQQREWLEGLVGLLLWTSAAAFFFYAISKPRKTRR